MEIDQWKNCHRLRIQTITLYLYAGCSHLKAIKELVENEPVLSKNLESPPSYVDATASQTVRPRTLPLMAPVIIPRELTRPHVMLNVIGITAEPMRTPMNRYTHPRLTCVENVSFEKPVSLRTKVQFLGRV